MTLPALIQKQQKAETTSRLKKFYSAMSQAILLSEIDNGPSKEWDKTQMLYNENGDYDSAANRDLEMAFFNKYLKPYLKHLKFEENPKDLQDEETGQAVSIRIHLSDGSYFNMYNGACMDLDFDTNGTRPPNKSGRDIFKFILCPKDKAVGECGGNKNWCAYCPSCNTREFALQRCKTSAVYCGRLLMMDNWEFKDDYPWKL